MIDSRFDEKVTYADIVWMKRIPSKMEMCMYKLVQRTLLTKDRL